MNNKILQIFTLFVLLLPLSLRIKAQSNKNDWPRIPGFGPESPFSLTNQQTFIGVAGMAAISYTLAEFVFKNSTNTNYYQIRSGMNNEHFWAMKKVCHQNFGVEQRVAPWFAIAAEFNLQQFWDETPNIDQKGKLGLGAGVMTYYRWYLFGKKRVSPYLEYGTGLFYGFNKFPYNGTNFTFSHSTQIGCEYTFASKNKMRFGYGQFHQSNNGWLTPNPGFDGNGFSISYSWFWKSNK